ncbi:hypothetical protein [Streptococcus sp. 2018162]|uniref:hypothetical protein n=1 Tax=Streptococcus sp. 2018162 TaxID=2870783 RepID=UPI001C8DD0C3|nr:hypothetical protein [Streptococcus sp. 2018162]MBY0730791.1 hypothetical protein [Streptococcus sp. 2018162]
MGCDCHDQQPKWELAYFNPRTRVGCDLATLFKSFTIVISTHAPVWGATLALALEEAIR